ncbi:high mobility group nucleosomal binding domain 1, isoform CRA_b [Rattus norvegicus]|uniref:High mobility group nucleosomal binding domain 1, isoform CRA_b n=1 Tax=Rattus norvegicus TaxID=10116 RepID=A6KPS6_RAT|nr:high mobility group nucleosomal binding domain 1, isoform CRA_b [Rattus norvegicus]EDL76669.1 high mobility group nucleosomal binding domain 1, isoform CRA_b [Rattus norvegicus]EDL76670.1 high mobility group nucleosomal binding domain 1, isoform CRA_b [Rattus norvegicus]
MLSGLERQIRGRALAALPEVLSSIPSNHRVVQNHIWCPLPPQRGGVHAERAQCHTWFLSLERYTQLVCDNVMWNSLSTWFTAAYCIWLSCVLLLMCTARTWGMLRL